MRQKNIFVTGATGNVGQPVVRELLNRGYAVTVLVRKPTAIEGCKTVVGGLGDIEYVTDEASGADGIIHLANSRQDSRIPVTLEDIFGTGTLLEAWSAGNFIFASSQTVYGTPTRELTEASRLNPENWYDFGKVCNELQVDLVARQCVGDRRAGISLRLALLYGLGDRRDGQFLSYVYTACNQQSTFVFETEEALECCGSSFIDQSDLSCAVVDSLGLTESGSYNIAGGFCTWRYLIELICKYGCMNPRFLVRAGPELHSNECRLPQSRSVLDGAAFAARTGFSPASSIEDTVRAFVIREKHV